MNVITRKGMVQLSILVCSLICLASCAGNDLGQASPFGVDRVDNLEGVSIEMTESTYQTEGETFELLVSNESDEEMTYGVEYILEYYDEDAWYEVEPDEEIVFILIAHILESGQEAAEEIDLSYYEPLEPGDYRIVREVEGEALTGEFEIIEE